MAKDVRGFGSMGPAKQREISSKGGRAAHEKGTAYEWDSESARAAGRKGGAVTRRKSLEARKKKAGSQDPFIHGVGVGVGESDMS